MVSERAAAQTEVGGRVYYYHNDHLMTPVFMTDSSGWAVWTLAQGPFEDYLVNTDHDGDKVNVYNPFRFPGQYSDPETNDMFWYNWNRYYVPELGRYGQGDPIGLYADNVLYPYAINNPTGYFDRNGMLYGVPAGEEYGAEAAEYYAGRTTDPNCTASCQVGNTAGGLLSSLWSSDVASTATTITLLSALGIEAILIPTPDDEDEPENPNPIPPEEQKKPNVDYSGYYLEYLECIEGCYELAKNPTKYHCTGDDAVKAVKDCIEACKNFFEH